MIYPISIACLLLFSFAGTAQSTITLANLNAVTIQLKVPDDLSLYRKAFAHFEVIDERPDTARIGIHTFIPTVGSTRNRQLTFSRSAAVELADYLNTNYTEPTAHNSALIVLRSLWLSDASYPHEDMVENPEKLHERTHIRIKAEIYIARDSLFLPLLRFDTLQIYKRDNRYTSITSYYSLWNKDLSALLNTMVDSAAILSRSREGHLRTINRKDIEEFNRSRFQSPMLENSALTPGVYTSYNECRNNTPSIFHFEVRLENDFRLLYIREDGGSTYYSHQAWGCSDGRTIYRMRDGVLYPLWREGKAFYFLAPPTPPLLGTDGKPIENARTTATAKRETMQRRIYTVDMDTGEVY